MSSNSDAMMAECRAIAVAEATIEAKKIAFLEVEAELIKNNDTVRLKKLVELKNGSK